MSKTAAIIIRTSDVRINEKVYKDIIDTLLQNGWHIDKEKGILFMQNGTYDFELASVQDFEHVVALLGNSIVHNKECFIELMWDGLMSVEVTYLNSNSIMFSLSEEVINLRNVNVVDFSFYIERISCIFNVIDLNRLECIYD